MAIGVEAAGFIGASVTLILVIVFMILMVILVRQCLQFLSKRRSIREQIEQQNQARQQGQQRRRLSVTEPVPATFDWHHSIRVEGTPPPTYIEAEKLPAFEKEKKSGLGKEKFINGSIDNKLSNEDSKTDGTGTTPLIINGFEDNRSNSLSGRESVEVAIAVEPTRDHHTQPSPSIQAQNTTSPRSVHSHSSQDHSRVRRESPQGDVEFSTGYTEYTAP